MSRSIGADGQSIGKRKIYMGSYKKRRGDVESDGAGGPVSKVTASVST